MNTRKWPTIELNTELQKLEARANQFLKRLGMKHKVVVQNDSWSDSGIEFDGTGIGVSISTASENTILGAKESIAYGAYTTHFIPGVRYHRDGSGTPDDCELNFLCEAKNPEEALIQAIKVLCEFEISLVLEAEAEDAFAMDVYV